MILPSLASHPFAITAHIWAAENNFIESFWTESKGPEQLAGAESNSNLGPKQELSGQNVLKKKSGVPNNSALYS